VKNYSPFLDRSLDTKDLPNFFAPFNAIKDAKRLSAADMVGLFVYYLTVDAEERAATPSAVRRRFEECDLTPPARVAAYLSEGVSNNPQNM
jgi:hypothetical protein